MDPDRDAALAATVRYSDDAVVHTTLDGEIELWSPGAERLFGYPAAEVRGRSIGVLYPAGAWSGAQRYAGTFGSDARQFEARLVGKGGREVTAVVTAFRVTGSGGRTTALGTIYRDVGHQRRTERRMLYKDALAGLLQTLVDVANEAQTAETALAEGLKLICSHHRWQLGHAVVFPAHPGGRVPLLTAWHTDQEARFAPFIEFSKTCDYATAHRAFLGDVLATRAPVWVSDLTAIATGARTGVLVSAGMRSGFSFPVVVGGEVIAVLEFFADETREPDPLLLESIDRVSRSFARVIERQRAFDEKARLAAIVEGASDAIIGRSNDGTITSWNPGAERLLGFTAEEAIGRPIEMTLVPDRHALVAANNERLRRGERVENQESLRLRKDGSTVNVEANVSPVRDGRGTVVGAAVILRDITEALQNRRALVHKVQLNALMQALTRTANEAADADAALHACLRLIAEHGRWDAARLLRFESDGPRTVSALAVVSSRHIGETPAARPDLEWLSSTGEPLVPQLLTVDDPVWLESRERFADAGSARVARRHGMQCAFAFPVVSNGRTLAVLEFFSAAPRERDAMLLENAGNIGGQLARVVERHGFVADIARSERRLRAILDSEPACVKVVAADGSLLEMNRAGLEFLEAGSIEEIESRGLLSAVAPEHRQRMRESIQRTIAGERCNLEIEIVGLRGARRWVESHTAPFTLEDGSVAMLAVTRDITDRKRAEARVNYFAHHDSLTGLPNRSLFQDRLRVAIAHARRRGESIGVMIVALDRFRKVNESFGYDAGDELLRHVAARMGSTLREVDTLARLGADQFAVLIEGGSSLRDLSGVAEKIRAALGAPIVIAGHEVFVTASTGIACYPAHAADSHALLEAAEHAMNRVKEEGGGDYLVSQGTGGGASAAAFGIEAALRNAVRLGELRVHYQPKIDFATGGFTGVEALLRWTSAELGVVSPAQFIPIAEETGLIVPIGEWVLETACAQAAEWYRAGRPLRVAVNLSPRQFRQGELAVVVERVLSSSGLPAQYLELEITETTAMSNPVQAAQVLTALHALGVKLAVDDFGTGYSSLSYLREFPLDCLKIDRSFVNEICASASDEAIVRATIALAHSLQLTVVAEGVETAEQHERLARLGCDEGQGYLYGAAMSAAELDSIRAKASSRGSGASLVKSRIPYTISRPSH